MAASAEKAEYYLIEKDEMENFMERCMLTVGTKKDHAKSMASCLIAADYRGHFSHGLNRLGDLNGNEFFSKPNKKKNFCPQIN